MVNQEELLLKIQAYRDGAYEFQERRHEDWRENYELYRDKVTINRLTQRQTVNVPIMKETLLTMLSKTDEAPDIKFKDKGGDEQKELFFNEYWLKHLEDEKLELKDIVDKKNVYFYGRSFKKFNLADGRIKTTVEDPHDILVDRFCDPTDIETAMYLSHIHIYKPLRELEDNEFYDKTALAILREKYTNTEEGLQKSSENEESLRDRNQRLQDMGDTEIVNPEIGETILEVNEHYIKLWQEGEDGAPGEFKIHVVATVDDQILMDESLEDLLGVNFYPLTSWTGDIEGTDFWSDGVADIVRTPNKVLNAWLSQLVENRTLRNFGMNYYDATNENFVPQTFSPVPWGWYPVPGKPSEVVQNVTIPDLSESLDEMTFLIQMVERSTAVTGSEKGTNEKPGITLGEIQLMAKNATERITSVAKFYRIAWKEYAQKWEMLVHANAEELEDVKLFKKSYKGKIWPKDVTYTDWYSEEGYLCQVTSGAEQEQEDLATLQRLDAIAQKYPSNIPLQKILLAKMLDLGGLNPEEKREVAEFEQKLLDEAQRQAEIAAQQAKDQAMAEAHQQQQTQQQSQALDQTIAGQQQAMA